ncbi:large conductance mechanosensitive channel protein MscL [Pseudactinotalea sp. HY160]|uniref:large conductance mechanosensitive channel protein MscL n=1 Tax=Pseudactinotalea sp. HY160 TaxID=2654490 RepID=UPI00128B7659|nr:large conductance mechanosensitive channel protein MscL [Pseudactinotalea sp. HY160]MPV48597.1 large conductance mechanosensitive channel protein MscL [Pseudactinotalea sp. HY160]
MLQGFKDFISRGNAIEMAVGIIIGAAFGSVVTALVENVINPFIGWVFGQPNLDRIWVITTTDSEILVGSVLTALVNFLLIALAVYLAIIVPMNKLAERRARGTEPEPEPLSEDLQLLTEIRDLLAERRVG